MRAAMPEYAQHSGVEDEPMRGAAPTPALWVSTAPSGEADALLRVFACPQGELSVMARGLRRSTSKLAHLFLPADELRLSLARGRGRLSVLTGASLHQSHAPWRADLYLLALYWFFVECACLGTAGPGQNEQVYTLVANLLRTTPQDDGARYGALCAFCLKLLAVHGVLLGLGHCCIDGHAFEPGEPVHLLPSGEGLIGREAYNAHYARSAGGLLRLDAVRLARWRRLHGGPLLDYAACQADSVDAAVLLHLCSRSIADVAARPVHSAGFLARQWKLPEQALWPTS
jgi:recombinational DNA repair protein (RecF pathway)